MRPRCSRRRRPLPLAHDRHALHPALGRGDVGSHVEAAEEPEPHDQQACEGRADPALREKLMHGGEVIAAGRRRKRRVRVLFAEVVEPRLVVARPSIGRADRVAMMPEVAYEAGRGPAGALHAGLDATERVRGDSLAHQDPANLPASGAPQFALPEGDDRSREQDLHHRASRATRRETRSRRSGPPRSGRRPHPCRRADLVDSRPTAWPFLGD